MCAAEFALAQRFGTDRARDVIADAWLATAWVGTERLVDALGDAADLSTVLSLHPAIPPGFARTVTTGDESVRVTLTPETPALLDPNQPGWIGALARGEKRGLQGCVEPLAPSALVEVVHVHDGKIDIDIATDAREPAAHEPDPVAFMRIGMLATWKFAS